MTRIRYWLSSKKLQMAQLKDLSRQLQEAWDDAAGDEYLRDQLHRVARERDNERKLRLEAEDKLLDYHLDKDADPMDGPEFIWVHLNHPCREIDV